MIASSEIDKNVMFVDHQILIPYQGGYDPSLKESLAYTNINIIITHAD